MKVPFQTVTLIIVHATVFLFLGVLKKTSQEIDYLVDISSTFSDSQGKCQMQFLF